MAENAEIMNTLYKEYGLSKDDVHIHKHYKIITRAGINKIEAKANIEIDYQVIKAERDEVVLLASGVMRGENDKIISTIKTFGEATIDQIVVAADGTKVMTYKGNVGQNPPYLFAMAEKRAKSRAVLILAGFYAQGFFGEDEADDFKNVVKESRNARRNDPDEQEVERAPNNALIKKVPLKK